MEPTPLADSQLDLSGLNPAQRAAVETLEGPLLILAGPGSGKTRVVTYRIANLLRNNVPSKRILALTFTNKAADEMKVRVRSLVPDTRIWISTFHRFCSRLLRSHAAEVGYQENFTILDAADSRRMLKEVLGDHDIEGVKFTLEEIATAISAAKNNVHTPDEFREHARRPIDRFVAEIYPHYQRMMQQSNAFDFDDLLLYAAVMLRENPELRSTLDARYEYILVDEYQDTNTAQYALARALSIEHPNLAVTGDPDQSIYGWRGANISNILEFERDFPDARVVRLEENYRSTPNILRVADQLIRHNQRRMDKGLFTNNPEGDRVRLIRYASQSEEAGDIARQIARDISSGKRRASEVAIFYRTHAVSRTLEHALVEQGVAYQVLNGAEFYQRKEVKDILSYLHLLNNPQNDVALLRVINAPVRGIGKKTVERLQEHAKSRGMTLLEAAHVCREISSLSKRAADAITKFVTMIEGLREHVTDPVEEIIGRVLADSRYRDNLEESANEEDLQRLANVDELLGAAREYDALNPAPASLEGYLEQVSLVSDTDDLAGEIEKVSLMTLHSAKGLEFPSVYIMAVEEGFLPHERNHDDASAVEEERRLFFVGLTRAEQELQLSVAGKRLRRGAMLPTIPSHFLLELPLDEMESIGPTYTRPADVPPVWDEHEVTIDSMEEVRVEIEPKAAKSSPLPIVMTAAQLASGNKRQRPRLDPELFHQGMVVSHPDYGSGLIITLSGLGKKRLAKVRFFNEKRERPFFLANSDLRPVGGEDGTSE